MRVRRIPNARYARAFHARSLNGCGENENERTNERNWAARIYRLVFMARDAPPETINAKTQDCRNHERMKMTVFTRQTCNSYSLNYILVFQGSLNVESSAIIQTGRSTDLVRQSSPLKT